jgi:hypothetical protein
MAVFVLLVLQASARAQTTQTYPTGTFINGYLAESWSTTQWDTEMKDLSTAGNTSIIIQAVATASTYNQTPPLLYRYYPSTVLKNLGYAYGGNDVIANALTYGKAHGIKVYIGLNFDDSWWYNENNTSWLTTAMNLGNSMASEINTMEHLSNYSGTFAGWYWPWEMDNWNLADSTKLSACAAALALSDGYLHKLTPGLPVMISPFMNATSSLYTSSTWQTDLNSLFTQSKFGNGDIMAPQDSVGGTTMTVAQLPTWFAAIKASVPAGSGIVLWCNTETFFTATDGLLHPANLIEILNQMQAVKPYVTNIVTFSYVHYQSPYGDWMTGLSAPGNYQALWVAYFFGITNNLKPGPVTNLTGVRNANASITLNWGAATDKYGICTYSIYRSDANHPSALVCILGIPEQGQLATTWTDTSASAGVTYTYQLIPTSFMGLNSLALTTVTVN